MLIQPDCIPCIFQMAVSGMHELGLPENLQRKLCRRIAEIPALAAGEWNVTSPDVIEAVLNCLGEELDEPDPFRDLKAEQNRAMLAMKPRLRARVHRSGDSLARALQLAVLGNAVDLMLADRPEDLEAEMRTRPLPGKAIEAFRACVSRSRRIVYLADNAGEIVLDGVLIEEIRRLHGAEIILLVRSLPAMNDITLSETASAGLPDDLVVKENGIRGPYPGTKLDRCVPEVRRLIETCDLIVSKGGGNFDSLGEEPEEITGKTAFLLLSKCRPYCERFGASMLDPVLVPPGAFMASR